MTFTPKPAASANAGRTSLFQLGDLGPVWQRSVLAVNAPARNWMIITIAALSLLWPAPAYAKRKAPAPVAPVLWQGVEYRAPLDIEQMGYVQAFDLSSGRKLWETKLYDVQINPSLEEDVQWVFISGLQVQSGQLLVTNEDGKRYRLNLKTGRVEGFLQSWLLRLAVAFIVIGAAFFLWTRSRRDKPTSPANRGTFGV